MNIDINTIIHNQPTICIGMIGSVNNGKSSLTNQISNTKTLRFSTEKQYNKTIKLSYANAKIFKCSKCPKPICYDSKNSSTITIFCKYCNEEMKLIKHVSFVDSPGHNDLMLTMINGTCVMDTTILVTSIGNEIFPASQTKEHINIANIMNLKNAMVCINKVDLVKQDIAKQQMNKLRLFLKNTIAENSPFVPIMANYGYNKDVVCEYICNIPEPEKKYNSDVKLIIIRSFNINKQGTKIKDLKGGVIGGAIIEGILKVGDEVILFPGIISKGKKTKWMYEPLKTIVKSINTENNNLEYAIPGGLLGVQLDIDPSLTAQNRLVGNILKTYKNDIKTCENVYQTLLVYPKIFRKEYMIKKNDILFINHNSCTIESKVIKCKETFRYILDNNNDYIIDDNGKKKKEKLLGAELELINKPIYAKKGDNIALCKKIGNSLITSNIVVIGKAEISTGLKCEIVN